MANRKKRGGDLSQFLDLQVRRINETFQMMEVPAPSSLEKADGSEVTKLTDEISKQATVAGMLWSGEENDTEALKENMKAYFNVLQGFILVCYGSTVGAGPTLHKSIHGSTKRVVDSSLAMFNEALSLYESGNPKRRVVIPQLAGVVWEASAAFKKGPTTNYTAIGRAVTQLGVYVKDVLREMNELVSQDSSSPNNKTAVDSDIDSDGNSDDLSPEEMVVAKLVITVVTHTYTVLKEFIRFVTLNRGAKEQTSVDPLEKILSFCREMADLVNDLGACVYPPQENSQIKSNVNSLYGVIRGAHEEIESIAVGGSPGEVFGALDQLKSCLGELESVLGGDLADGLEKLSV